MLNLISYELKERISPMNRHLFLLLAVLLWSSRLFSQQFSSAIEDNSYFIEEAYNQEFRIVQHISTGYYQTNMKSFLYSFTQEWPAGGQNHQLSYTIPYQSMNAGARGLGDILINYRYQMWDEDNWGWIAPRISLVLPTGNTSMNLGNGVLGIQGCIPLSKRWSNELISHFNIGAIVLPNVEGTTERGTAVHQTLLSYFAGTSGIWLLSSNFNLMCEVLYSHNSEIDESGTVVYSNQTIVSPGFRFAINLGDLQIVPGLAFPVVFESGRSTMNVYAYLSFEHPY
jgi:hypothetical protein